MPKKQNKKQPIAKQVWQWAEDVSPEEIEENHILTAYRLRLGKCKACRKNCSTNPVCLRGLGESQWLKSNNYKTDLDEEIKDLKNNVRKEGEFVGLKNLGATCYVNTFLQLWFHNLNFRKSVYSFKENLAVGEPFPQSPCGHLQLMFGMLENSKRTNVDPTPFVKCLGLDTDLQQDAQEFSKLFLNLLNQNSEVGNILCQEFRGQYEYCTKCKFCGAISKRPSKFYELDLNIQGHNNVKDCLKEFLQEELLEKDNQYLCETCNCRRDASRQIVIKKLPRTLNLQLLRFVFDKTTCSKKKLSRVLTFPDVLDLTPHISADDSHKSFEYDLTAVLIHRGPSAFSGHYIANIKDGVTGLWHKFNDENVNQLKSGKKLDLDTPANDDFDIDLPTAPKIPKVRKNNHSSKDAYMLVYTRRECATDAPEIMTSVVIDMPEDVKQAVEKDNSEFLMTIDSTIANAENEINLKCDRQSEVSSALKEMYEMEISDLLANCVWVPTTWLKHTLSNIHINSKEISFDKFTCSHDKLDPMRVTGLKCISKDVASVLLHGKSVESLSRDLLCWECVKQRCHVLRTRLAITRDYDEVMNIVKQVENNEDGFYIGKYSLKCWKSILAQKLEPCSTPAKNMGPEVSGTEISDEETMNFNEDLLCEHGNFTLDAKSYCVIPTNAWHILEKHFPDAVRYPTGGNVVPCATCIIDSESAKQEYELKKVVAAEQKACLHNLLSNRNRPVYHDFIDCRQTTFFVVTSSFVMQWRCFVRNPLKNDIVSSVNNAPLICPHGGLLCDPISSLYGAEDSESDVVVLWPSEWGYISKNFSVDVLISISRKEHTPKYVNGERDIGLDSSVPRVATSYSELLSNDKLVYNGTDPCDSEAVTANIISEENIDLKFSPDLCKECILGVKLEKEQSLRTFTDKVIYIKRVLPEDKDQWIKDNGLVNEAVNTRKRKRATARGEKSVVVSSNWTIKELKIKIMQLYSVPPFDQNLWMNSRRLTDDEATLGDMSVLPESTVVVIADEPDEKSLEFIPVHPESSNFTEEGFKGTSLIGRI